MSNLREQLDSKLKDSMIAKDEAIVSLLRMIKSSIKNAEIAKGHDLEDPEILVVLEKEAKQRKDSIDQFTAGNRLDLAEKEKFELNIIESYLPEKMSEEEIREVVKKVAGDNSGSDFGRVMGAVMGELKGKADGALVQKIVKEVMEA
jgi:uncharacterized protein YqeY